MQNHISTTNPSAPLSSFESELESSTDNFDRLEIDDESQRCTLFVGDLDRATTREDVFELFSRVGQVRDVRLKHAKVTKHPLGYGFVDMEDHEIAAECVQQLHGETLRGKQISVRWASRNKKLFIANLSRSTSLSEVLSLCQVYGTVCPEKSSLNKSDSGNIYAVVEFDRREAAEAAKLALHGSVFELHGEQITIFANWEQSLSYRTSQSSPSVDPSPFPYYSVHISFQAVVANVRVSEKMIYQAYKSFGKMTTVTIKNIFLDQNTRTQKGYGFIHFETIEGARTAVDKGACLLIGGVNYKAEFSKHLSKRGERKMTNSGIEAQTQDIPSRNAGIQWGYPPSPAHHVPQFPGHSGPQFPGHHAPQFPSGNYGVYAVCYPPGSFSSSYQMPYSALPWQDPYGGDSGYPNHYGPY